MLLCFLAIMQQVEVSWTNLTDLLSTTFNHFCFLWSQSTVAGISTQCWLQINSWPNSSSWNAGLARHCSLQVQMAWWKGVNMVYQKYCWGLENTPRISQCQHLTLDGRYESLSPSTFWWSVIAWRAGQREIKRHGVLKLYICSLKQQTIISGLRTTGKTKCSR